MTAMDAKLEQLEAALNSINVLNAGKKPLRCWHSSCRMWNPSRWRPSVCEMPLQSINKSKNSSSVKMPRCGMN